MRRLDEVMAALRDWLAATTRPVYVGVPGIVPPLPWTQLEPEWNNLASDYGLDGLHYRRQYVFVRTYGRAFDDAGWLSDRNLALLVGPKPPAAPFILSVTCEAAGTPSVDREGRMHVERRVVLTYA